MVATAGKWHAGVGAFEFRFAVAVLTAFAWIVTWLSLLGGPGSLGAYLLGAYAAAMAINVVLPHLAASIALHRYAPGLATALLLNAPVCTWILYAGVRSQTMEPGRLAVATVITVPFLLGMIPLLFRLGRAIRWGLETGS